MDDFRHDCLRCELLALHDGCESCVRDFEVGYNQGFLVGIGAALAFIDASDRQVEKAIAGYSQMQAFYVGYGFGANADHDKGQGVR